VDSNTKLITQERQYKAEISLLRGQLTTLEDSLLMKEDEVTNNKANVDNMKSIVRQLELEKNELAGERMKLRNELKNMQQSTAASYKLESSQGIGAGVDADTAIRINEATSDAKVRTLTNKVDFLKAQLGAEQSAMEEMREGMETNRRIMEEMKNEFRLQLNEAEQNKRKAVEDAERRVEMVYEERMSELTTLQTRVMMVQGQLNEAFQESTIMKQREENLKQQSAKANAQQAALKSEIDQLRAQVNDLRDEKEQILSKDMNKHSSEAVIRRLDNERQYLKSQLASEITLKNELQTALSAAQNQLASVQGQWKIDVDTLKDAAVKESNDRQNTEARLTQSKLYLEGEVARLGTQCRDLKDAFTKVRDQVRMEQLALENSNTTNLRFKEQLEDAKIEISMLKTSEEEAVMAR
jgi:chromosome segregation ATPase